MILCLHNCPAAPTTPFIIFFPTYTNFHSFIFTALALWCGTSSLSCYTQLNSFFTSSQVLIYFPLCPCVATSPLFFYCFENTQSEHVVLLLPTHAAIKGRGRNGATILAFYPSLNSTRPDSPSQLSHKNFKSNNTTANRTQPNPNSPSQLDFAQLHYFSSFYDEYDGKSEFKTVKPIEFHT